MKRYLLTQMKNEWKENLWLLLELIIVSVVVWILVLMMAGQVSGIFMPRGFEYEDVYVATLKRVSPSSPQFTVAADTTAEGLYRAAADEIRQLTERIRSYPYVEAVGTGRNALPYNYNYVGTNYFSIKDNGDTVYYSGNERIVSPEMAEVLRYQSLTGQTLSEMREALSKGEILFAPGPDLKLPEKDYAQLKGTRFYSQYGTDEYTVGGTVNVVRRSDYEAAYDGTFIVPVDESDDRGLVAGSSDVAIRVKPGYGARLMEEFRTNPEFSRQRNLLMRNLRSLENVRTSCQWGPDVKLRQYSIGIMCLLIIVFLGLLGTFWFRVQQRVSEIAIRKVAGATARDIFRRMISESLLLVAVATLVSWGIEYAVLHFGLVNVYDWQQHLTLVGGCALGVLLMLVLAVPAGVFLPARSAMKIEPAVALKSE